MRIGSLISLRQRRYAVMTTPAFPLHQLLCRPAADLSPNSSG
jgi:hypothetical protein